ncbi:acylneuraminate cytidylyltransferase family protein [Alphaproteobacteria bacterium]|nr:acylneuraminate cytidylyltransferase family protein [Alphaproteobacteria bacterium]
MSTSTKNKCCAVIPARGGSKGVPGKNIKLLNGKPLLQYTVDSVLAAGCFDRVIVTSDCHEILSVAFDLGVEAHLRVNTEESNDVVMADIPVITCLESIPLEVRPEFSFMLQCTSPLVKVDSYRNAYRALLENPDATIFAAHEAHVFLWQKAPSDDNDTWLPVNHPFYERIGRQFAKHKQVNELGAFYGFRTSSFIEARHRFFSKAQPVLLEESEIIDIDTYEDWSLAEFKLQRDEMENA